ncbi:transporter substrate-binding domain-containing protein [Herbaspirillum sp. AP02]|uniref:transporter substrate-binding domain-containing protein n=1 Tax=unclassified Herbaspirillum TaxID=2624150 RepID=UPI0015DBADEC|nr:MULTISPECIES: transporter substrate-binding domain-containing protein [unclassified Herbaspirillum]MBG7620383.1 transporter substrate-binding domain-containing protein [Herbaspirillum sp. AP02]NZD67847.1 transporter substrate-binding domain-containing protein [Herbaspirillum sp. AP21]
MSISRRHFIQSALAGSAVLTLPDVFAQDIESTMARIKRTGKLRLGAINGATPYFNKDLATQEWKGFCADFGRDLAKHLKAEVEWVETTWGNAVLDVQTNKIDAQLAMAPTPQRREVVDFSNPLYNNINTVVARKGLDFKTWEELNRPEIKVAVDVGSSHDQLVTRILPKATILRFETSAAATMALQSGRADCQVLVVLLSTSLLVKLPTIGHIVFPTPDETAPTNVGIRKQADQSFVTAVNGWLEEARKAGRIREIIVSNMENLAKVPANAFPPQLKF